MAIIDMDLDYLRYCLEHAEFTPIEWDGEDRNLGAFRSREELIEWYCQPPGAVGQPYRDRGFYCRELAHLSRIIRPRTLVEFGTSLGVGTCLLRWLNPQAYSMVTVDVNLQSFMPGDVRVQTGHIALHQAIHCRYIRCNSWEYAQRGVDFCFIDADHSYEAVVADSERALANHSTDHKWTIVWHDHNDRHPGVVQAVAEFCKTHSLSLQSRLDSDTVWVEGNGRGHFLYES